MSIADRNTRVIEVVDQAAAALWISALVLLAMLWSLGTATAQQQNPQPPAAAPEVDEPPVPDPPRFIKDVSGAIGDIAGDVFFWGQSANLTGDVLNNAFLGGQIVTIDKGTVGSDVFAFAQSVVIDGEVRHNVYAFASSVLIAEGAVIHGNVRSFAGSLRNEGRIRGQLQGSAGTVFLDGEIGSVDIEAGTLTIAPTVNIAGALRYQSKDEATIPEGANVGGPTTWNPPKSDDQDGTDEDSGSGGSLWGLGWKVWLYVSNLLVGVAALLLGGRNARLPAVCLRRQPAPGLGFGFVVTVVFPIASVLAIALVVSLPLGVIGLVVFALMIFFSRLVTAQFLGDWILRRLGGGKAPSEYLALAVGLLLLYLVAMIPYVGFLTRAAAIVLGIGGMFLALRSAGSPAATTSASSSAVSDLETA